MGQRSDPAGIDFGDGRLVKLPGRRARALALAALTCVMGALLPGSTGLVRGADPAALALVLVGLIAAGVLAVLRHARAGAPVRPCGDGSHEVIAGQ